MTLSEIAQSDQPYLDPADIAPILRCDPQCIRAQAHRDPAAMGYPVIVIGNRVRIPRIPFLHYMGYSELSYFT